jgi:hypothetical protein
MNGRGVESHKHKQPMKTVKYPDWVCSECGMKHGRHNPGIATWHIGRCDICGEEKSVTDSWSFGHIKSGWME